MKSIAFALLLLSLTVVGCTSQSGQANPENEKDKTNKAAKVNSSEGESTEVALNPENTTIQFVCNHTDKEDPDPRSGKFQKFAGKAKINKGQLDSLQVDIETSSVKADKDGLTKHLKEPDFFDAKNHPKATFQTTSIEADGEDKVNITGDLTLLDETKSITFPATVSVADDLSLQAEFKIDRSQFGMDYGVDKIEKEVQMTVTIGK